MRVSVVLCVFVAVVASVAGQDSTRVRGPPLVSTLPVSSPPPDYSALQRQLSANRAKWRAQGFRRYRMTIRVNCFCLPEARGPFDLVVAEGAVVSATPDNEFSRNVPTIGKLFALIQDAINDGAANIQVTFNPRFGYPASVFIDRVQIAFK